MNSFYKESKSKKKIFFLVGVGGVGGGCRVGGGRGRWTDRDEQATAQTNLPLQLLRNRGA